MKLHSRRPVYLNLLRIRLPMAGVMSIIHRASGLAMFFATPALVWLLACSLSGPEGFEQVKALLQSWMGKAVLFCALWALLHHLFAGIRYLLIDVDVGVERPAYRYSAWAVTLAGPLSALAMMGVL
jgi:succinate dehydrogenase / fumarate reductase cytochrome b subunit